MQIKKLLKLIKESSPTYSWLPYLNIIVSCGYTVDYGKEILLKFFTMISDLVNHIGEDKTIVVLKDLSSKSARLAMRTKTDFSDIGGVKYKLIYVSKFNYPKLIRFWGSNYPKRFQFILPLLHDHPRAALTILNFVRATRGSINYDIGTIINPKVEIDTNEEDKILLNGLRKYISKYGYNIKSQMEEFYKCDIFSTLSSFRCHSSMAAGPMGPPALLHIAGDTLSVINNKDFTLGEFINSCYALGREDLIKMIEIFYHNAYDQGLIQSHAKSSVWPKVQDGETNNPANRLARLHFIQDKAGKTRIIYISNYFLQDLLYPFHQLLMRWLKTQTQDGTYDQAYAADQLRIKTANREPVWCFDLSAATDRFPLELQTILISSIYGDVVGKNWAKIISIPAYVDKLKRYVRYAVGQPMGAYSSWSTFAATHHVLIRYCCMRARCNFKDSYIVLGDDVAIFNNKVAQYYKRIITLLGVNISESKSFVPESQVDSKDSAGEFAKRLYFNGENYSPISTILLYQIFNLRQSHKLVDLIRESFDSGEHLFIGSKFYLHDVLHRMLAHFSSKEQRELIILLSNPFRMIATNYHKSIGLAEQDMSYSVDSDSDIFVSNFNGPVSKELSKHEYLNPWMDEKLTTMKINMAYGSELVEIYAKATKQVMEVKDKMITYQSDFVSSQRIDVRLLPRGYSKWAVQDFILLEGFHPIKVILDRIDVNIKRRAYQIQHNMAMPVDPTSLDLQEVEMMVEVDFVNSIIIGDKDYKSWMSLRDKRNKRFASLIVKVFNEISNPPQPVEFVFNPDDWRD